MPIIHTSSYKAPFLLRNADVMTMMTSKLRPRHKLSLMRHRLELPDGDFLDVDKVAAKPCDFADNGPEQGRAVIVSHGLEGNSSRRYMLGMARIFTENGWDVFLRNFRGCSGEMNRLPRFYHGGETDDLDFVVRWAIAQGYTSLVLVGFSMGGNQTLKYLGEKGLAEELPEGVRGAVTFSVPCDFVSGAARIDEPRNTAYLIYFMRSLCAKVRLKAALFPDDINLTGLETMRSFAEFDNQFTAPMFGFASAEDYWTKASCRPYLPSIKVPTLLVNALDDPFLTPLCYPFKEARDNKNLYFEVPHHGGHVGFALLNRSNQFWSEIRAMEFVRQIMAE